MSPALEELPRKLQRLLDGKCRYALCSEPLKDGSCYCSEHDAQVRAQGAVRQAKLRTKFARDRLCIDGCGTRVSRSSRGKRCSACTKANRERSEKWRSKRECDERSENVTPELKTKLEMHPDGYVRVRNTGRGVRGQKSREELDEDLRADLEVAELEISQVRTEGIAHLRSEEVHVLGRIAKQEAQSIVADRLRRAAKTALAVANELDASGTRALIQLLQEVARTGGDDD